jgi:hypothetical protein
MKFRNAKTGICLCLCLALSMPVFAQERPEQNTNESCSEFVGKFYTWYLGMVLRNNDRSRKSDTALKSRPYLFSPDLIQELKEDSNAQKKAGSDLVSLDADPFLGADGPAARYIVERITIKDGKCWAEVHGVRERKESETAEVTPELVLKGGRWVFVNFYFPSPSDPKAVNLLSGLKDLREFRKQNGPGTDKKP